MTKRKRVILIIFVVIVLAFFGWYFYSHYQCAHFCDNGCKAKCDFRSIIMENYDCNMCPPLWYGMWDSVIWDCDCIGDVCLCWSLPNSYAIIGSKPEIVDLHEIYTDNNKERDDYDVWKERCEYVNKNLRCWRYDCSLEWYKHNYNLCWD